MAKYPFGARKGMRRRYAGKPSFAITAASSQNEGNSGATLFNFPVTLTGFVSGSYAVNWAVTGSGGNPANAADFTGGVLPSGTLTFTGNGTQNAVVSVAGDTNFEPDEGFTVTLSSPTNGAVIGTASAGSTILNDDAAAAIMPRTDMAYERFSVLSLAPQADGTDVTSLTGSIAGLVGTQGTSANCGKYKVNITGSNPAIRFSAIQNLDFGRPAGLLSAVANNNAVIVMVVRNFGTASTNYCTIAGGSPAEGFPSGLFDFRGSSTGVQCGSDNYAYSRMVGLAASDFQVLIFVQDAQTAQSKMYVNGTNLFATLQGGVTSTGSGNWRIGEKGDGYGGAFDFHECVILSGTGTNGQFTQADAIAMTNYFHDLYGVARPCDQKSDFWLFTGDSTVSGTGSSNGANKGYDMPSVVARAQTRPIGTWSNAGVPGYNMAQLISNTTKHLVGITAICGKTVKLFAYETTNRSTALPTAQNDDISFIQGLKTAQPTMKIAFGNSIDQQSNNASTTTLASAGADRQTYNANMAGAGNAAYVAAGVDRFVDLAANANIGAAHACEFGMSFPSTYWNDAKHPTGSVTTPNGYKEMADIVGPHMAAL